MFPSHCVKREAHFPITYFARAQYNIPLPGPMELGDIQVLQFPGSSMVTKYVAWCATVMNDSSTFEIIEGVARKVGEFTQRHPEVRLVETPLLGTGHGHLSVEQSGLALAKGFRGTAHENATLVIFSMHSELVEKVQTAVERGTRTAASQHVIVESLVQGTPVRRASETSTRRPDREVNESVKLVQQIRKALGYVLDDEGSAQSSEKYHEQFVSSGRQKADNILTELRKYPDIPLRKLAYVSIGGSTGAEIVKVLDVSPIESGVLLEHDEHAIEIARQEAERVRAGGKELHLVPGDASQKVENVKSKLMEWRKTKHLEGVIISAQAVLHELPTRSPNFDLDHFLGELFWEWPVCFFFCRETCAPANWPKRVRLKVAGVESPVVEALAKHIKAYLKMGGKVQRKGPEFVEML